MKKLANILYDEEEGISIITLNRPERLNALSSALVEELVGLLDELERRNEVGAVIITGAPRPDGRPCFCGGADLKELAERGAKPP